MNISKLALIALLGGALTGLGCSDDGGSGTAGTGGTAATGGSGGSGGDTGGTGGGGLDPVCADIADACGSVPIDDIEETCMLPAPPEEDGCDGTESLENPATCAAADNSIIVGITQLQLNGDCDAGYDLDSCSGYSCAVGSFALGEGMGGVDNAIAGLGPVLAGLGNNLSGVDQALHDGICSGAIAIAFTIDANTEANCANVDILDADGAVERSIIMNFSDTACLSGTVGSIPLNVGGVPGALDNALLRATVSNGGLSNGMLGGTIPEATAAAIADLLVDGGAAIVGQVLDINGDLSGATADACDSVSTTMTIGGVEVVPAEQ